jgi:hypothetical protein
VELNMGANTKRAQTWPPQGNDRRLSRTHEIERTLLHIKGLVYVRAILENEGASPVEIAEHSAELERQRRHLADLVRAFYADDRDGRRTPTSRLGR